MINLKSCLLLIWLALSGFEVVFAAAPESSSGALLLAQIHLAGGPVAEKPVPAPAASRLDRIRERHQGRYLRRGRLPVRHGIRRAQRPGHWCDVLSLHLNTKYCHAAPDNQQNRAARQHRQKIHQPLEDAYPLEFTYRVASATAKYLDIQLSADKGPMNTRDYRIQLQAIPLANGRTFLHMTYFYAYGWAGRSP
jgi:hypothetical protein